MARSGTNGQKIMQTWRADPELAKRIDETCEKSGESRSEFMRTAAERELKRRAKSSGR